MADTQFLGKILKGHNRPIYTDRQLVSRLKLKLKIHPNDWPKVLSKAAMVVEKLPDPGGPPSDRVGLMLGRIQAGKTNAMITTTALAIDNGYKVIVVLTSDNTWLYQQTLKRFKQLQLPGLVCAGMEDWDAKKGQIKSAMSRGVVLVATKNSSRLERLLEFLAELEAKDAPALIFDDEADQASLDTNVKKPQKGRSPINGLISTLRSFFYIRGFIEVTATPQSLLLLDRTSEFRPSFIVVLEPGTGYIGGDVYFQPNSPYLNPVELNEVAALKRKDAPSRLPSGLEQALRTFLVSAAARYLSADTAEPAFSFLVHVSLSQAHHGRLRDLIQDHINDLAEALSGTGIIGHQVRASFAAIYANWVRPNVELPPLDQVMQVLEEYVGSVDVQVLNASNEQREPNYDSLFNILIGGTKLGRGVTIKGLLVTYYGRESKKPQMDTVQQHARMYGYRQADLQLSRIFLPDELASYFRGINTSEAELREWLDERPNADIHPLIIPTGMKPTRSNVLNPGNVGCYIPGKSYTPSTAAFLNYNDLALTEQLDEQLGRPGRGSYARKEITADEAISLLSTLPTVHSDVGRWDHARIQAALQTLKSTYHNKAHLVVFSDRDLSPNEKPNVADSDDLQKAPANLPTIFMFRQNASKAKNWPMGVPFWVPVVRFPDGPYPVGFNFS